MWSRSNIKKHKSKREVIKNTNKKTKKEKERKRKKKKKEVQERKKFKKENEYWFCTEKKKDEEWSLEGVEKKNKNKRPHREFVVLFHDGLLW